VAGMIDQSTTYPSTLLDRSAPASPPTNCCPPPPRIQPTNTHKNAGMGPELTRGVLSAALMLMLKERLYVMNRTLLLRQRGYAHA
jgi:hypothetical protein